MTDLPLVSVIVLSYRRPALLRSAIDTALAQDWPHIEVIVVDNHSDESATIATIAASYPGVRLIQHAQNLGFTGGMNAGIAAARGDYVYLTEDDLELETGCVRALVSYLREHADAGLAGAVMLNHDDGTIRCAGGQVNLGHTFSLTILGAGEPQPSAPSEPYHVSYVPGATMMARRQLFEELDGFRNDFFMYMEDVELCCRVLQRGLHVAVVPDARVAHRRPDGSPSPGVEFWKIRNLATLYFVHAPLAVIPEFVLRYGVVGSIRAMGNGREAALTHLRAWGTALIQAPRVLARRLAAQRGGPSA